MAVRYIDIPLYRDSPINWSTGDDAVCVMAHPWKTTLGEPCVGPEIGEVRKVLSVMISRGVQWLGLEGYSEGSYIASSFTKARPREEETERKEERFDFRKITAPARETEDA